MASPKALSRVSPLLCMPALKCQTLDGNELSERAGHLGQLPSIPKNKEEKKIRPTSPAQVSLLTVEASPDQEVSNMSFDRNVTTGQSLARLVFVSAVQASGVALASRAVF